MRERLRRRLGTENKVIRALRTVGYAAITLCGFLIVTNVIYPFWYNIMGWFLIVGGGLSLVGAAWGRWAGEFMGLPLLAAAMASFAILNHLDNGWQGAASGALLAAYSVFMIARWLDMRKIGRAARLEYQRGR